MRSQQIIQSILAKADIEINGSRPWDIEVKDDRLYSRVLRQGSLGLGESYMDGWWECAQLDEFFTRVLRHDLREHMKSNWPVIASALVAHLTNPQRRAKAFEIGERHYDVGNDLYRAMLDRRMTYTCGYWNPSTSSGQGMTLDDAQEAKLDLVCRKIGLKSGQHVLDIGCGWGSFAKFAAERYGARVTGLTVSKEQAALGREMCAGLPVEIVLQDYREVVGTFDHIVSLGMFEHVGSKNYRTFMQVAHRCLKDDGLFLLHTIGGNRSVTSTDPWIGKYIFPNSMLPSVAQIARSVEGLFVMEDWHNFSAYYEKTLMAWYANFEGWWNHGNPPVYPLGKGGLEAIPPLPDQRSPEALAKGEGGQRGVGGRYDGCFHRMWRYYLLSCAGSFRSRNNQLWQIVFSKNGVYDGYNSIR